MILIGAALGASLVLSYRVATSPRPLAAPLRQTHDAYSSDGRIHDRWVYREGQLVEHLEDRNSDGSWDCWLNYEDGWVSRVEYDNNFDGRPDETLYYKNGRLVSFEKDTDFNGIPDEFGTCKDNLVQELDIRPNGSKFTITREIYSNGVPTEIQRGGDANGHFKETVKYDAFYNPISTDQTATTYPLLPVH